MITKEKIDRINKLAKKAKGEGLTPEEQIEQKELRAEYVASFRANLKAQLDQIEIVEDVEKSKGLEKDEYIVEIEEKIN